MLHVDVVGDFNVEWHMRADMKTIKAMYGLKNGRGCEMHCIYCEQKQIKVTMGIATEARATIKARSKNTWEGGLSMGSTSEEPCDIEMHGRWWSILPTPLLRVHICTLHAQVRLTEKFLHMYIMYVWNIPN